MNSCKYIIKNELELPISCRTSFKKKRGYNIYFEPNGVLVRTHHEMNCLFHWQDISSTLF
jgi:hypothetical protein